jgi:signal transduction histidine kinase
MSWVLASPVNAQEADRSTQVLIMNSTRLEEQISGVSVRELPKLLADGLGGSVDYYAEYLDIPRFPQPEYESAYVDFLRLKYKGRRVDLIFLVGDIAINFMSRHRHVLFGDIPAVFFAHNPPRSPLNNSTGVISQLHFNRSIDLALALQPDLKRVYVVSGAGALDQGYERQARTEFRPFAGRIEFTYLTGLATKELLQRLGTLPPHSAVYFVVMSLDGAGEHPQQMTLLSRLASAANAPTYSWADAAVETGILGGARRDQLAQMKATATLGVRVLRGERADSIPVSSPNTDVDSVDWRQLRRFGLDESRVPPGARVLFREPSFWDQYERYVVGAVMLVLAQTALIAGLLVQRTKRRHVELELRGSQTRLRVSYDRIRLLSRQLLVEQEAERARIARELHDDINQQLAILSIELDQLRSDDAHASSAKLVSQAMETAQSVSKSLRELSHRLHPEKLTLVGLVPGLQGLCHDLSPSHRSIAFSYRDVPARIDTSIALCLFRVAQEALGNAVKHSGAGHVWVDLTGGASTLALTIADDGVGFDVDAVSQGGLGLISMRERVESVGGALEIHTTPTAGTRLTVTVPTHIAEPAPAEMSSV